MKFSFQRIGMIGQTAKTREPALKLRFLSHGTLQSNAWQTLCNPEGGYTWLFVGGGQEGRRHWGKEFERPEETQRTCELRLYVQLAEADGLIGSVLPGRPEEHPYCTQALQDRSNVEAGW